MSALGDTPGWFTPLSPEPGATDYAGQEANRSSGRRRSRSRSCSTSGPNLEADAGGNPSWNIGVNYFADLVKLADYQEVVALYQAAGRNLSADVQKLQAAPRIAADPKAVFYLARNIAFNGHISVPVLTMHTTGDGLVVPENEQAYRSVVDRARRANCPAGVRGPRRALRVHPGRDDHRGTGTAQPAGHRVLERAQPGRHEQPRRQHSGRTTTSSR